MKLDKNTLILIADDNAVSREMLRVTLSNIGFENIRQAEDGEQALAMGREFPPRFALLDIYMPETDGWEVARKFKKELPGTIVIMVSASRDMVDMEESVGAGVDGYIFKPVETESLLKEMTAHIT